MHFSSTTTTAVIFALSLISPSLSAVLTSRNLHTSLYCVDETPAQSFTVGPEVTENNDATQKACDAYKARNVPGGQAQNTCPDCSTSFSGDVLVCNSPAKYLGANEMTDFCKAAGADRGQA